MESSRPVSFCFGDSCRIALAGLLIGLIAGVVLYSIQRRGASLDAYRLLDEVDGIKLRILEAWRTERLRDLEFLTSDPKNRREYARVEGGDAVARGRLAGDLETFRRREGLESLLFLGRDGRILVAVPQDAALPEPGALSLEAPVVGGTGRVILHYSERNPIARMVNFWPTRDAGAESALVSASGGAVYALNRGGRDHVLLPRAGEKRFFERALSGESGRMEGRDRNGNFCYATSRRVPGSDWILVSKLRRDMVLRPLLQRALLVGLSSAGLAVFSMLLIMRERRVRAIDAERALLAKAIDQAAESVMITDANSVIQYVNPAFSSVSGYSREEAVGRKPNMLKSGKHDRRFYEELWATLARDATWRGRIINRRKDDTLFEEETSIAPVRGENGIVTHYIGVKRDVTNEMALQSQLRHSQKMEAVGRLAGGIAHDFNNILTSVLGYTEMAASALPPKSPVQGDLAEVIKAGKHAAALTRQLLTFSRKQIVEPVTLDLCRPVAALEKMLRRTIGEDVALALELHDSPLWVRIDPVQIEQIVLNLAINARDAMPKGGLLRIGTGAVDLRGSIALAYWVVPPGRYARLAVIDDGEGMDASVLEHIFEPFFTTKKEGGGTGLGLATVFGIVRQAGGYILADSMPGRGCSLLIYLPLVAAPVEEASAACAPLRVDSGSETVLVVEDQDEVRSVAERVLRSAGYTVLSGKDGREALAVEAAHRGGIHLLLSDVVMPGMSGAEVAERMAERRSGIRVLFMSGYTDENVARAGVLKPGVELIEKPFVPSDLLARVRGILDSGRAAT